MTDPSSLSLPIATAADSCSDTGCSGEEDLFSGVGRTDLSMLEPANGEQKTCRLVTLGCKVNQYETQLVLEALERHGYREAREEENADLCVVNTCTVTNMGDSKSRQVIRQLAKRNPGTRTLVMGCYATRDPLAVAELPSVFEVITNKQELPDVLMRHGIQVPSGISRFEGRKRAFVKVQDGCILRCTYCIIPKVRPGLQSRTPQQIEEEFRRLIDQGHKEIVISGVHVGHYGVDTTRGRSGKKPFRLWHLFRQLDRIPGDWRMRLSSIEAVEVNDEFISAAADCEHLCPQFHPALQSGSDTVLQRMRRRYEVQKFLDKLHRMRQRLDNPSFTTDVIVGFPGETEAEFQQTIETCREAQFSKIHVFPFSARKDTPAALMPNQLSPELIKQRVHQLSVVERDLAMQYYETLIGREVNVLVERGNSETGLYKGTDERYLPVQLTGNDEDLGNFVRGTVVSVNRDYVKVNR